MGLVEDSNADARIREKCKEAEQSGIIQRDASPWTETKIENDFNSLSPPTKL